MKRYNNSHVHHRPATTKWLRHHVAATCTRTSIKTSVHVISRTQWNGHGHRCWNHADGWMDATRARCWYRHNIHTCPCRSPFYTRMPTMLCQFRILRSFLRTFLTCVRRYAFLCFVCCLHCACLECTRPSTTSLPVPPTWPLLLFLVPCFLEFFLSVLLPFV